MGNYVWAVNRKSITATLPSGEEVKLWFLKYLYKPSYSRPDFNRPYQMALARIGNAWERSVEKPDYIVSVDEKPEIGAHVRKWPPHRCWYNDGNDTPGEHVGYLVKQGRRWVVLPGYPPQPEPQNVARPEPTIGSGIAPVPAG